MNILTAQERATLEEIKRRGRTFKLAVAGFIAVGLIGGIPVNDRPLLLIPLAMFVMLVVSGFFWSLAVWCMAQRARHRCPRCQDFFFAVRGLRWLPFGGRALWGRRCTNCGLGFRDLKRALGVAVRDAA